MFSVAMVGLTGLTVNGTMIEGRLRDDDRATVTPANYRAPGGEPAWFN